MNDLTLCILVPAYNYFEGVERILDLVKLDDRVSVVISDDSDDSICANKIYTKVKNLNTERITYVVGPGEGACKNWNSLFKYINAKYYTFLHHDEVYSNLLFVDLLQKDSKLDCLILPCWVIHSNGIRRISSGCQKVTMYVAKKFLPIFNFLGPTSTVIIKKSITPKFNSDLNWYIDVEWVFRVLARCSRNVRFGGNSSVVESYQYENSITNSSIESIRTLAQKEKRILFENGYKWTILRWYLYGFMISKSIFYTFSCYSYCRFLSMITFRRIINPFFRPY